jgi:hypothetical protein
VDYVEITYSQDRDGDYSFYYNIFFNNKKKTEILNNSLLDSEKVVLINNILTKNQVKIDLEPINSSQWISIDRQYSDAVFSTLEQLYGVD